MTRVLFVDDERPVLDACRRALRKKINIDTALGPAEALKQISEGKDFAVIVSDMRMPEMTGVQLLAEVKRRSPDTVRMMLTGNSDQQTAIDAVNEGDIFRFLNKPCPPDKLWGSVEAALAQHRLIIAERDLLENTLQGTIQVLADVLALVNPSAFGRTTRIRSQVTAIATTLGLPELWRFETMATLSHITELVDGMTLAADVTSSQGTLVLCKGQQTTDSVRARLINFARNGVIELKVMVWMSGTEA